MIYNQSAYAIIKSVKRIKLNNMNKLWNETEKKIICVNIKY